MDAKAIKATLKSAREAIREKDYKEALRHCKVNWCVGGEVIIINNIHNSIGI